MPLSLQLVIMGWL